MKKLQFKVNVNASREKLWHCLWNIHCYETWTAAFAEGSTVQTDHWKEGSKVYFTDGSENGMVSMISVHQENEFMSFTHLGMLNDGVEDTSSEKVAEWAGSVESYRLTEQGTGTLLEVEVNVPDEYEDSFRKSCEAAHDIVKALAEGKTNPVITVRATIKASTDTVWQSWTHPEHIKQWNHASPDWHCPAASNELIPGGGFSYTMAAKDGSFSFDFSGKYTVIEENKKIQVILDDGRSWKTWFNEKNGEVEVIEKFEAESMNPLDLQQTGWQAILNNFKQYTEQL